jgi:hypothetical protein
VICGLIAVAAGSVAEAQVVAGRFAEPAEMSPSSLSVSYVVSGCNLEVSTSLQPDRKHLAELRIELCSKPIAIGQDCLAKFVEPALGSFGILAAGLSQEPDKDLYILHMAIRMIQNPRNSYFSPPFMRLTFDGTGVKECDERTAR